MIQKTVIDPKQFLEKIVQYFVYLTFISVISGADVDNNLTETDTTSIPETKYKLKTIIVTAGRLPTTFNRLTRSVDIISQEELKHSPVITIDELLESVPGVNVQKRGPYGVQSDISIRGATFEQTLVLIDGIKMTDPQTGHHSMNLPFSIKDVKKVEILKGAGSRMYGPNAFGGVINIITKVSEKRVTNIDMSYGDYGFNEISLSTSLPVGSILNQNLSFNRKTSFGYRDDTDFETISLNYRSSLNTKASMLKLMAGYIDKEFGAYSFYSTFYPNEWEHTTTAFVNTQGRFEVGFAKLSVNTYWRRNRDDFILIREDPGFYRNIHTTDVFGLDMQSSFETSWGSIALGGEYNQDRIESTNLGDHARPRAGLFTEYSNRFFNRLDAVLGVNGYYIGDIGWKLLPGIDVGFAFTERMRIYGSVNRSFRVPTFTELYYESPYNMGNSNLNVEEGTSYELGCRWLQTAFLTTVSIFHRAGNNLIDWVKEDDNDPWTARNIAAINTSGVEFSLKLSPQTIIEWLPIESVRIGYTYLKMDRKTDGFESKYIFNNFTHQTIMDIKHNLPYGLKQSWVLRREAPVNDKARTLIDMRLDRKISKVDVYLSATNLLDVKYTDLTSVPLPGRWLRTGLSLSF